MLYLELEIPSAAVPITPTIQLQTHVLDQSTKPIVALPSDALILNENETYGRHFIAKRNIMEGEILGSTYPFASVRYVSCTGSGCFTCGKNECKIQCDHCIDVFFCDKKCSLNRAHKKRCDSMYSKNDCERIRLVTKIINEASKKMSNIQLFLKFCYAMIFNRENSEPFQSLYPEYARIFELKEMPEDTQNFTATRVVKIIKLLPQFKSIDKQGERILFYVASHHATCLPLNTFSDSQEITKGGTVHKYKIFTSLSIFNHSCDPNVYHYMDDGDYDYFDDANEMTYCVATKPITKGEQLFINYFGDSQVLKTIEERRSPL